METSIFLSWGMVATNAPLLKRIAGVMNCLENVSRGRLSGIWSSLALAELEIIKKRIRKGNFCKAIGMDILLCRSLNRSNVSQLN